MDNFYMQNIEDIFKELNSNNDGLTSDDAVSRIDRFGKNEYAKPQKDSLLKKIIHQFRDISMIILLIASAISFIMAWKNDNGYIEPIIILGIMIMNISLTIVQERNAEKALDELSDMNTPECIVIRDGCRRMISKSEIVPGDIVELRMGDLVPADARVIKCVNFEVDESSLTGESEPIEKNTDILSDNNVPIADRKNMVFSNCYVTKGKATVVVVSTGMNTEMGKIASFLNKPKKVSTPLQTKLNKVINLISFVSIVASILVLIIGVMRGENIWNMMITTILLAVAATPETLSLIVTLCLTHGVRNIVKKHGLIRKLHAVETLGSVSVICSDKTGTLTQNKMEVKKIWINNQDVFKPADKFNEKKSEFIKKLAMVSNVDMYKQGNSVGNPTEMAIVRLFFDVKEKIENRYVKVHEIPFSSERKLMTVIFKDNSNNKYLVLTKGAIDRLSFINADMKKIKEVHDQFADDALRVIALGSKEIDDIPDDVSEIEKDLEFEGMVGIIDPPRPDAKASVEIARNAGIRTIMITGDHSKTASAIAKEIGILTDDKKVMSGPELANISEEGLSEIVKDYAVYARVSPEDKLKIVKAWKNNGCIVSMTGDGINDAPAMKESDVGVAMGINGTEVAKNSADLVLTDDNFSTIIEAIREGRCIYSNIQKTVCFLVICCVSELATMIFAQLANLGNLMNPIMLLMIDLLGTGLPSLYFSKEFPDENIMKFKPNHPKNGIFDRTTLFKVICQVFLVSSVTVLSFCVGKFFRLFNLNPCLEIGQTMAFLVLGISSILNIFNISSKKSIFKNNWRKNPPLVYVSMFTMSILILLVMVPQFGGYVMGSVKISFIHWIIVLMLSIIPISFSEFMKIKR